MRRELSLIIYLCAFIAAPALAQDPPPGEGPNLGERIIQEMVEHVLSFREIRKEGLRIFSTPFNRHDGLGDGPMDPLDPVSLGGRPTLQNNGMFLRMNGLDSQTCLECHSVLSSATIPATFARVRISANGSFRRWSNMFCRSGRFVRKGYGSFRRDATPFNRHDGLGDGPMDPLDPVSLGGRPTLQNNGMFLRMNGLDSQTCLESRPLEGLGRGNATKVTNVLLVSCLTSSLNCFYDGRAVSGTCRRTGTVKKSDMP